MRISLRFRTAAARIPGAGIRNRSGFPALPRAAVRTRICTPSPHRKRGCSNVGSDAVAGSLAAGRRRRALRRGHGGGRRRFRAAPGGNVHGGVRVRRGPGQPLRRLRRGRRRGGGPGGDGRRRHPPRVLRLQRRGRIRRRAHLRGRAGSPHRTAGGRPRRPPAGGPGHPGRPRSRHRPGAHPPDRCRVPGRPCSAGLRSAEVPAPSSSRIRPATGWRSPTPWPPCWEYPAGPVPAAGGRRAAGAPAEDRDHRGGAAGRGIRLLRRRGSGPARRRAHHPAGGEQAAGRPGCWCSAPTISARPWCRPPGCWATT